MAVQESCASTGRVITELTAVAVVMDECQAWETELEACLACISSGLTKDTCVSWGINCDRYTQWDTECRTPEPEPDAEPGLEGELEPRPVVVIDPAAPPPSEAPAGLVALAVVSLTFAACCCIGVVGVVWVRHRRTEKQKVYANREPPPMPAKATQEVPPTPEPTPKPVSESLGLVRTPAARKGATVLWFRCQAHRTDTVTWRSRQRSRGGAHRQPHRPERVDVSDCRPR